MAAVSPVLTPGTCQALFVGSIDVQDLPTVQLVGREQHFEFLGVRYNPPIWIVRISDGSHVFNVVAGRDFAGQLSHNVLHANDVVKIVGYRRFHAPNDMTNVSILVENVVLVSAHPTRIGNPGLIENARVLFSPAYNSMIRSPPDYSWLPSNLRDELRIYPLPTPTAHPPAPVTHPPAPATHPPAPLAGPVSTPAAPLQAAQPTQQTPTSSVRHPIGGFYFPPGHPLYNNPSYMHPGSGSNDPPGGPPGDPVGQGAQTLDEFDSIQYLGIGDLVDVQGRVTRIDKQRVTIDLIIHDTTGCIDMVVRKEQVEGMRRLRIGKVYTFRKCQTIKSAKYCRTFHSAQLSFEKGSSCSLVDPDDTGIPERWIELWDLDKLRGGFSNRPIDVICVIMNTSGIMAGRKKSRGTRGWQSGGSTTRVDVWLTDKTCRAVRLAAFDEYPEQLEGKDGAIVLLKNVVMDDSLPGEVCLKTLRGLTEILDPEDVPGMAIEYQELNAWWLATKDDPTMWTVLALSCSADGAVALRNLSMATMAPEMLIGQVHSKGLGRSRFPSTVKIVGKIDVMKRNSVTYIGCASPNCNKKVEPANLLPNGRYRCEVCGLVFESGVAKFRLYFNICDRAGSLQHAVAFNTAASQAMALDAVDVRQMQALGADDFEYHNMYQWAVSAVENVEFLITVQARVESEGAFQGREQWIAIEFLRV